LANSGALKALAARRLALRRLDCLRFGLAMRGSVLSADVYSNARAFLVKGSE
jgi:hypothetical protein